MATIPGTGRLAALSTTPAAPPPGYVIFYFKTDNILYIQDSGGAETPIGTASGITSLTGDVTGMGPGAAATVVAFVGGKTAAQIATSVNATLAATSANNASTLVLRDASGNFAASIITANLIGNVTGNASGNVLKTGDTMTGPLNINSGASNALIVDTNVLVVDGALNRVGINKVNPTQALDVVGNILASGTVSGTNISGTNSGDVTISDTATIDLTLTGQLLSADVRLSNATINSDAGGIKVGTVPAAQVSGLAAVATSGLKADVGLGNVDNTSDATKNAATATLTNKTLTAPVINSPTGIVKADVGLGNVDNTSDVNKPVSTAQAAADTAVQSFAIQRANHTGTQLSSTISDFTETAQDSIGAALTNTSTVNFTYNDPANTITADVNNGSITDSKIASGIDAVKIGAGTVSNTEYGYLDGVTSSIQTQLNSISGSGITSLTGDVTGTGPGATATTVASVGGSSAANISSAELAANAATSANTPSTIVKRDSSGNFAASTITANLTGNVSGSAGSFTGSLVGDVTGTQGATVVSSVGGKTSAQVATSVNDTSAATATNTPSTIVKRDGSGNFAASALTVTTVNGVTVESHASRHLPTGADPLTTAAPSTNLDSTTTNATGTANSLSRSDHSHAISTGTASTQTPDQTNAAGSSANLAKADHTHNIPSGTPVQIGTSNFNGAAASFALSDHIHAHGNQSSGTLHAAATTSVNGFMSSVDKTKLDNSTASNTPSTLVLRDSSGNFAAGTITANLTGNASGSASSFTGSLVGDVTGTQGATTVAAVGGKTASAIAQSVNDTVAATDANTFSTIAKRDANGDLSVRDLTARNVKHTGFAEFTQTTTPATPASTKSDLYTTVGNGLSILRFIDDTGFVTAVTRDTVFRVKNNTGSTILKGQAVYANGSDITASLATIALAKANSSTTLPVLGLAAEAIATGTVGRVTVVGFLGGIDTSGFAAGSTVYVSETTAGALTVTRPTSPNIWQRVGTVITSNAVSGIIEIRPFGTHGEESGTNTAWTSNVVALIDAATIVTDASLGNIFTVTLAGNRTLANPTNGVDGQKVTWRIRQDATGSRTLTYGANFNFPPSIAGLSLSTSSNTFDYLGAQFNGATNKWDVLAFTPGLS